MKIHLARVRKAPFGEGVLTTSLCGRLNATSADGMNISDAETEVTCRFCLRRMKITARLRAAKAAREASQK